MVCGVTYKSEAFCFATALNTWFRVYGTANFIIPYGVGAVAGTEGVAGVAGVAAAPSAGGA